ERDAGGHLISSRGPGPVELRARSWLHANCAHCHRRHGGGSAPLEVNFDRALSEAALLWERPTRGDFGLTEARALVPGQPWRSVLNYRVSAIGSGHMPLIGAREVDKAGAALLWEWVAGLPVETRSEEPPLDPFDESQLASTSSAMRLAHAAATGALDDVGKKRAIEAGLSSPRPEVRALFERFRPPAERPLPRRHQAATILKLTGDPDSGSEILSPTGKLAVCFSCHRIGEAGVDFGPNLSDVGGRLSREALLESILEPSRTVLPEFALWTVETAKGEAVTGLMAEKTNEILTMKIGPEVSREIGLAEVIRQSPSAASAMPEGLADFLEPQEVADLLAALAALKSIGN
ncbi:MAG: hypothetical protein KDL87_16670, partial [Verrucomicrobiae bacterium]|nr:hypothetical protein [Verrucomicrobiae bacterium]